MPLISSSSSFIERTWQFFRNATRVFTNNSVVYLRGGGRGYEPPPLISNIVRLLCYTTKFLVPFSHEKILNTPLQWLSIGTYIIGMHYHNNIIYYIIKYTGFVRFRTYVVHNRLKMIYKQTSYRCIVSCK